MHTEIFNAGTIEEAVDEILKALQEDTDTSRSRRLSRRDNVLYFDGWEGLGASAVLRAMAQRLATTSPAGLEFDQVIHIDCSMWESRRALQRAVAEQLNLPNEVMELFDRQDEEDDFYGVPQGFRAEIQQVTMEIYHMLKNCRFLVIFHNGSNEEIDLASCGFLLSRFSTSKVLWTFQGRFRLKPKVKVEATIKSAGTTHVFLLAVCRKGFLEPEVWSYLVRQEAEEVSAACKSIINRPDPEQVAECFLYMLELCGGGRHSNDYDLATHCTNYWACDGIIHQLQPGDGHMDAWRTADAIRREMRLDADYHQDLSGHLAMSAERKPYWTSPTSGCILVVPTGAVPNRGLFQHYADRLCVLKLSCCTLDFQSLPFLCCHSLRFLWLDHCQQGNSSTCTNGAREEEDIRHCFQRLWVLDVRYTNCDTILSAHILDLMTQLRELNVMGAQEWDMGQLQGRLPNIRKLRVTKSLVRCSCSSDVLISKMYKMELLDFSGNSTDSPRMSLSGPGVSSSQSSLLDSVTIDDGCHLRRISFRGCTKLKNLLFGGRMPGLRTLDISGTSVKTLDLTATEIEYLDELYLLGCEKLHAILWPPRQMKRDLAKLCIDTTQQSAPTADESIEDKAKMGFISDTAGTSISAAALHAGSRSASHSDLGWYISVRDARLLISLMPVYYYYRKAYVEVSSIIAAAGSGSKSDERRALLTLQQHVPAIYAMDYPQQQTSKGDGDAPPGIMWTCPDVPSLPEKSCSMHIQDQTRTRLPLGGGEETSLITVPEFVIVCGHILHVHDGLSMATLPSDMMVLGSEWHMLEWCKVERCPRLECVFAPGRKSGGGFIYILRTLWVSQLPKARFVWTWSEPGFFRRLPDLTFLHIDCCPRLVHVLPLSRQVISRRKRKPSLNKLETLEIMWCQDLQEVFPLDTDATRYLELNRQPVATLDFPALKHIHLHELPSLQRICGVKVRMRAPNLETVKIRGCWSLTRLPDVDGGNKAVECDCEKEWWDNMQWDDDSQASHYKPIHSRYYKKTLLRTSVLR